MLGSKSMHDLVALEKVLDKILGIDFIRQYALSFNVLSDKYFWEKTTTDSGNLLAQK
jgi:hypothetical protein